jgi:hypothetical protein
MKRLEDFASRREYETYAKKRDGWIDFYASTGLMVLGLSVIILILLYGK